MQLTSIFSTLALAATAAAVAITPTVIEDSALEVRGGSRNASCPAEAPSYCGWFDQVNNQPPRCLPVVRNPPVMRKPVCGRKQYPYCAKNPGSFVPWDPAHAFCCDDGINIAICIDIELDVSGVQKLLGEIFCVIDKAVDLLGLQCLLNFGSCSAGWVKLNLGCTSAEILVMVKVGLCVVVKGVAGLLGKIVGIINIGINV